MGKALVPAGLPSERPLPKHWDKWVSAAYLRILGNTQKETAVAVGRNERRIREWESDEPMWNLAREEARKRWLRDLTDTSRKTVLKASDTDADLAFRVLERVDPDLAPPKQKHELTGADGSPLFKVYNDLDPDRV